MVLLKVFGSLVSNISLTSTFEQMSLLDNDKNFITDESAIASMFNEFHANFAPE